MGPLLVTTEGQWRWCWAEGQRGRSVSVCECASDSCTLCHTTEGLSSVTQNKETHCASSRPCKKLTAFLLLLWKGIKPPAQRFPPFVCFCGREEQRQHGWHCQACCYSTDFIIFISRSHTAQLKSNHLGRFTLRLKFKRPCRRPWSFSSPGFLLCWEPLPLLRIETAFSMEQTLFVWVALCLMDSLTHTWKTNGRDKKGCSSLYTNMV